MKIESLTTVEAYNSPSPISQAMRVGPVVYVSGQVGSHPSTGEVVGGGIRNQTVQAISNLAAIVKAAGGSLADVVKTTCFLTDFAGDGEAFNAVYATYFPHRPARSALGVMSLGPGQLVEIEAIAVIQPVKA